MDNKILNLELEIREREFELTKLKDDPRLYDMQKIILDSKIREYNYFLNLERANNG